MDSRDLTYEQCQWLERQLSQMTTRLYFVMTRFKHRKFPDDDKMYLLVCEAYDASWRASQHAHSLCGQGSMGTTFFFVDEKGIGQTKSKAERLKEERERDEAAKNLADGLDEFGLPKRFAPPNISEPS